MLLLLGVAFVAGIVTARLALRPPVLPIVLAGGATGGPRRPFAIVAGLVASFTVFTLTATALLGALGLPDDLLRNLAIAVVLARRPLAPLAAPRRPARAAVLRSRHGSSRATPAAGSSSALSLGLLFTPCAGPVIAAVATVAATRSLTVEAFLITLAYALGAGVVLLGFALAARRGMNLRGGARARARRPARPRRRRARGRRAHDPRASTGTADPGPGVHARAPGAGGERRRPGASSTTSWAGPASPTRSSSPTSATAPELQRDPGLAQLASRSRSPGCAARSSCSTSGRTPASTACARCRT